MTKYTSLTFEIIYVESAHIIKVVAGVIQSMFTHALML